MKRFFTHTTQKLRHQLLTGGVGVVLCMIAVGLVVPQPAAAGATAWGAEMIQGIAQSEGKLVVSLVSSLTSIAAFNDFTGPRAYPVTYGWTIVRDVANMFFILIMLIIALATILKVESYSYKSLLPKVIMLAVLVNFSKTICGVAIDAAQVFMRTFVAGFSAVGPGNLMAATGTEEMFSFNVDDVIKQLEQANPTASADWIVFGIAVAAFAFMTIMLVAVAILLVILVFRIVMLWFLVAISPLFFVLLAIPSASSYARQWSSLFAKYLITGPALAFFIWLAFASLGSFGDNIVTVESVSDPNAIAFLESGGANAAIEKVYTTGFMMNFAVSIGLLVAGLVIAGQMGAAGGGLASSFVGKLQNLGSKPLGFAGNLASKITSAPFKAGKAGGLWAARTADRGLVGLQRRLGVQAPLSLRPSKWKEGWKRRNDQQEKDIYFGVNEGMQDKFNSLIPWSTRKTKESKKAFMRQAREQIKDREEAGQEESDLLISQLEDLLVRGKDGKLRIDPQRSERAYGLLEQLTKNHDINEVLLEGKLGEQMKALGGFTPRNTVNLMKQLFGDEQGVGMFHQIAQTGLQNNDPQLWGYTRMTKEGAKEVELTNDEKQEALQKASAEGWKLDDNERGRVIAAARTRGDQRSDDEIAKEELDRQVLDAALEFKCGNVGARFFAKREPQEQARKLKRQSFYDEAYVDEIDEQGNVVYEKDKQTGEDIKDKDGNRVAKKARSMVYDQGIPDHGLATWMTTGGALVDHWNRAPNETRDSVRAGLPDLIRELHNDKSKLNAVQKDQIWQVVGKIVTGIDKPNDGVINALKAAKTEDMLKAANGYASQFRNVKGYNKTANQADDMARLQAIIGGKSASATAGAALAGAGQQAAKMDLTALNSHIEKFRSTVGAEADTLTAAVKGLETTIAGLKGNIPSDSVGQVNELSKKIEEAIKRTSAPEMSGVTRGAEYVKLAEEISLLKGILTQEKNQTKQGRVRGRGNGNRSR